MSSRPEGDNPSPFSDFNGVGRSASEKKRWKKHGRKEDKKVGVVVPKRSHLVSENPQKSPEIVFINNENRRDPDTDKYFTDVTGDRRFNERAPGVPEALRSAEDLLMDKLIVDPYEANKPLLKEARFKDYNITTVEQLNQYLLKYPQIVTDEHGRYRFPFPTSAASTGYFGETLFLWDLWSMNRFYNRFSSEGIEQAKNNINGLAYEFAIKGYYANGSKDSIDNRTQPPVMGMMLSDLEQVLPKTEENLNWLENMIEMDKVAYWNVWHHDSEIPQKYRDKYKFKRPFNSRRGRILKVKTSLANYGDTDTGEHRNAEASSGWDYSIPRFRLECSNAAAVDLNSYLAFSARYYAQHAEKQGNNEEAAFWWNEYIKRATELNRFDWNGEMYGDRNMRTGKFGGESAAGFMPLLTGAVPQGRMGSLLAKFYREFLSPYGMVLTTKKDSKMYSKKERGQWAYPNIFPMIAEMVAEGFLNNGIPEPAIALMEGLAVGLTEHAKKGKWAEKISAVSNKFGKGAVYEDQSEQGMTASAYHNIVTYLLPKAYEMRARQRGQKYVSQFSLN